MQPQSQYSPLRVLVPEENGSAQLRPPQPGSFIVTLPALVRFWGGWASTTVDHVLSFSVSEIACAVPHLAGQQLPPIGCLYLQKKHLLARHPINNDYSEWSLGAYPQKESETCFSSQQCWENILSCPSSNILADVILNPQQLSTSTSLDLSPTWGLCFQNQCWL